MRMRATTGGGASGGTALAAQVYDELRRLAARRLRAEADGHSLDPTDLVHEAYVKLAARPDCRFNDRAHFCATASRAMRQILVDHARARKRVKRGGDSGVRVTLAEIQLGASRPQEIDVLELSDALDRLARLDERQAAVIELRFFSGLSEVEAAELLGVSRRTVQEDWAHARAWLKREFERGK